MAINSCRHSTVWTLSRVLSRYHANKWIISTSFNYCYKTDRSRYNDSFDHSLFFSKFCGLAVWTGKVYLCSKGWWLESHIWLQPLDKPVGAGCSQVSYWLAYWLTEEAGPTRQVSQPSRLTWASIRWCPGSAKHSSCVYKAQYVWGPNLGVLLAKSGHVTKDKTNIERAITGFAKAWSTHFAINPLQSLLAQPCIRHVSQCSNQASQGRVYFGSLSEAPVYHNRGIMAVSGHITFPVRKQRKMNMNTASQTSFFSLLYPGP